MKKKWQKNRRKWPKIGKIKDRTEKSKKVSKKDEKMKKEIAQMEKEQKMKLANSFEFRRTYSEFSDQASQFRDLGLLPVCFLSIV